MDENPECRCGGIDGPHKIADPGCYREMAPVEPIPTGTGWSLPGGWLSDYTLTQQRGYCRHECERWSRQRDGSSNSIREELSEWDELLPSPSSPPVEKSDQELLISIVEDLNLECYDHLGADFIPFEVSSNGYATAVTFCGYQIWSTEDQGDRVYDEDTDTYEPLEGCLRREAMKLLRNLANLHTYLERKYGP